MNDLAGDSGNLGTRFWFERVPCTGPLELDPRFEELKRYVRFDAADTDLLRRFHAVGRPHFARIADEFYERIREHVDAHAVIKDEAQLLRLQNSLVAWMIRLCTGARDQQYFADTARIGAVHVRVGLPQRYVFTAMALIHIEFERLIDVHMSEEASAVRAAVTRALDLELAIMLESYHDDFVARLRRVELAEREQLGRALAQSEHRYVNAVELAPYIVVGLDGSLNVQLFNTEAERVTGYLRDEVRGCPFIASLFPEDIRDEYASMFATAIKGGRPAGQVWESALRTRGGKLRRVRWHLAHAPSDQTDSVVLFAMGRDITEENELAERTRQAEKLAAVGTLAAGLAHEIRNPLNGAQLHVTFLERGLKRMKCDADSLEAVQIVREELGRLGALVSEFLDFARPKPLDRKATSLETLCRRAATMVRADAANAGVLVELDLPKTDVIVDVDPSKIEQVLLNLLHNAIEAMAPLEGGRLTLRVRRQPLQAVVEVEDQGPGLTENAPVFDAFYSTKPKGTGLGLAIVHRIVTDHGGKIRISVSRPGCTIFQLTLPISSQSQPEAKIPAVMPSSAHEETNALMRGGLMERPPVSPDAEETSWVEPADHSSTKERGGGSSGH